MNTINTIKKTIMFFVMIFLVPLAFALQGDCDGNNLIEIPDIACMNQIVADQNLCNTTYNCSIMDANNDGNINELDIIFLENVLTENQNITEEQNSEDLNTENNLDEVQPLKGDCDGNNLIEIPDLACLTSLVSNQNITCSPVADCSNMNMDGDNDFDEYDIEALKYLLTNPTPINDTESNETESIDENELNETEFNYNSTACKELDANNDGFVTKEEANTSLNFIEDALSNGLSLDQIKFDFDGNGIMEIPDRSAIMSILSLLQIENSTMNISTCGFVNKTEDEDDQGEDEDNQGENESNIAPVIISSSSSSGGSGGSSHRHSLTRIIEAKPIVYPTTEVQEPVMVQDVKEVTDVIQTDNKFMGFAKKLVYEFIGAIVLIAMILGIYLWKRN